MCINGEEQESRLISMGLPQGSISPLLFRIYMGGIHTWVEERVQGVKGLSFVDDILWLATGTSVREVSGLLEKLEKEVVRWGEKNAVVFESKKTEAILFSKRKHWKDRAHSEVRVQGSLVPFNRKATRWLEVWINSKLSFGEHMRIYRERARRAKR